VASCGARRSLLGCSAASAETPKAMGRAAELGSLRGGGRGRRDFRSTRLSRMSHENNVHSSVFLVARDFFFGDSPIRLNFSACLISYGTVFFSHNKSANNTFQPSERGLRVQN
jgi:hypothetical protein